MTDSLLDQIKSRGYWRIVIRPVAFDANRIPMLLQCEELIRTMQVRNRGWYFPAISRDGISTGLDFVMSKSSAFMYREIWKFFQSGQFVCIRGLTEDWAEGRKDETGDYGPGEFLDILRTLYQVAEVYEFAARLGQEGVLTNDCVITLDLMNTANRTLGYPPGHQRALFGPYTCVSNNLPREESFKVTDLVSQSRQLIFEHFIWLMERFGFGHYPHDTAKQDIENFYSRHF